MKHILIALIVLSITLFAPPRKVFKGETVRLKNFKVQLEEALAATELTPGSMDFSQASGRADFIRFLYILVNGTIYDANGTALYTVTDGPGDGGLLGLIRMMLGPDALGGGLSAHGYTTCASIPSTGSVSITDSEGTFTMTFGAADKTIPSHFPNNAGESFDKLVTVDVDGTVFMKAQVKCAADSTLKSGYLRMNLDEDDGVSRAFETYFQSDSATGLVYLDFYMTYAPATYTEKLAVRFQTDVGTDYKMYLIRVEDKASGTDNSASIAAIGNATTQLTDLKMIFGSGGTPLTDSNAITASTNGSSIFEDCLSLSSNSTATGCPSVTSPGTLFNGSSWTINSVNSMTLTAVP